MQQVDGMKVIVLTRGDLTNTLVMIFFSEPTTCIVMYSRMVRSQQKP